MAGFIEHFRLNDRTSPFQWPRNPDYDDDLLANLRPVSKRIAAGFVPQYPKEAKPPSPMRLFTEFRTLNWPGLAPRRSTETP